MVGEATHGPGGGPSGWLRRILAMPNDSVEKTVATAVLLCLACSIVVSVAAVALKPLQVANKTLDIQRNILKVAGRLEPETDIPSAFANIETRIVDLENGAYVEELDPSTYDQRKAARDPSQNVTLSAQQDVAKIGSRARYATVYLAKKADSVDKIILPVHGYGLWSTMYGFLALEPDGNTVYGISFYEHAETPGLGGEIDNTDWKASWNGKKLYDESDDDVSFKVIKGSVDSGRAGAEHQVDGLAGATLTSNGVSNMIRYWLGQGGFGPYLTRIRSEQG
jgi:Na+-transporting NADH:ubiquinone oxidoreductase subunit C